MKVKVFQPNHHGKIEFTRAELEELLNEVYSDGYREGEFNARSRTWTWTSPYLTNTPYYNSTISTCNTKVDNSIDSLTCKSVNASNVAKSVVDNSATTCASVPSTYTVELKDVRCDSEALSKAVNKILSNAHKSIWNQAAHKDNDPIANLAKELNF